MGQGAIERTKEFREIGRSGGPEDTEEEAASEIFPPVISIQPSECIIELRNVLILTQAVDKPDTRVH